MELARDQAEGLRSIRRNRPGKPVRVIAIASGKGGVGKTQLVANLCVAFAKSGDRVLAIDGDVGMANLHIALGAATQGSILDVVNGKADIEQVLTPAGEGITLLPGGSGIYELANLTDLARQGLFSAIDTLDERYDTVIVDTPAGIGNNAVGFAAAAQDIVVVANLEPTSLADAYGLIKTLAQHRGVKHVHVVANMVRSAAEGEEVYRRLSLLVARFLTVGIDYMGHVMRDPSVPRAVHAGKPVTIGEPKAQASHCFEAIARRLQQQKHDVGFESGGVRLFWRRLLGSTTTETRESA